MWSQIKRFVDDLRYEILIIAIVMIVIPLVGASYLISGLTDPIDMQQLEQVAQSTRIAIVGRRQFPTISSEQSS